MVEDLEDADEAESHAESEEAARVGHEGDHRDLLVPHDRRHNWVVGKDETNSKYRRPFPRFINDLGTLKTLPKRTGNMKVI